MTIREALRRGAKQLRGHRCDGADPVREAEALLASATGLSRERMFMSPDLPLASGARRRFSSLVARRRRHAPLAYLLGTAWFAGLEFAVDRRVLIPRPATEHVLDTAVRAAVRTDAALVIDVGTGSGCVAIAAAKALPGARVLATDDSPAALRLARSNARRRSARVRFLRGDLLRPASAALTAARRPAVIIANLPYVPASSPVSPCVRREPRRAVFAPGDGTGPYRELFRQLAAIPLRAPATIVCELLPRQYLPLDKAFRRLFPDARPERIKNHRGRTVGLIART
ncbi:MAG TPA: HemK/PrmC family methyltransferase [Candidatus Binatia bacterium]|jgi:release factor glutamine methyltransferase|nr:HemK/PrmC family methyltransferase [Candidatus Binatia bacterium]